MTRKVLEAAHHRNGVSGAPFYVGIIQDDGDSRKLVVYFPELDANGDPLPYQTQVAVLDIDKAVSGNIYMYPEGAHEGGNAWRGDHYVSEAEAIEAEVERRINEVFENMRKSR